MKKLKFIFQVFLDRAGLEFLTIYIVILVFEGMGVIDCTDDCPGTEEEFKYFREVTEDPDFVTKFPIITGIGKNDKTKTKKMFLESLTKCKTFSEETLMVIQLAQGQR